MIDTLCESMSSLQINNTIQSYFINSIYPFEMYLHLNPSSTRQYIHDNFNTIVNNLPPFNPSLLTITKVSSVVYELTYSFEKYTLECFDDTLNYFRTDGKLMGDRTMHQVFKIKYGKLIPHMYQQEI